MSEFNDITGSFDGLYHPISALVIYQTKGSETQTYVEHFDLDRNGNLINAHPLTVKEGQQLAEALDSKEENSKAFLKPKSILPNTVLQINPAQDGTVLWYTKAQMRQLYFSDSMGISNGTANVPAMLWYANKHHLHVYALPNDRRPTEKTALCHAPFFNVYTNGDVCMGSVDINIKKSASLEEFTALWESYFFNSYFSHLMGEHNPVNGNCVSLWKELIATGCPFPAEMLVKTGKKLKSLLP